MNVNGVLGIDPGKTGGLAIYGFGGLLIEAMPVLEKGLDLKALSMWIDANRKLFDVAYIERVHAFPGQGVTSMFTFGEGFGAIQGVLTALEIPYVLVSPRVWMKDMHQGVDPELDSKERSKLAAKKHFPMIDFRKNDRCKNDHDGMVEAALIAAHGFRCAYLGSQQTLESPFARQ